MRGQIAFTWGIGFNVFRCPVVLVGGVPFIPLGAISFQVNS